MDNLQLLATLANLGRSILDQYKAINFLEEFQLGYNPLGWRGARLRGKTDALIFWDKGEFAKAQTYLYPDKSVEPLSGVGVVPSLVMVDDPEVKACFLASITNECREAAMFAKKCRERGTVPLEFINKKFATIQQGNPILRFNGPIERPTLDLVNTPIQYATLEDELETKAYLMPFIAGEGLKWIQSRECEECGKLFFYKLERARFCSQTCRIRANNKRRQAK